MGTLSTDATLLPREEVGLVVIRRPVRYRPGTERDYAELRRQLRTQDSFRPLVLDHVSAALFDLQGQIRNTYRFTTTGMQMICSHLAVGLSQLVSSLSGYNPRARGRDKHSNSVFSNSSAVEVLNTVIRLRFNSHLRGHALVVDPSSNVIDGIVGPRYERFSNLELLELAEDFLKRLERPFGFFDAKLHGRRVSIRYLDQSSSFSFPVGSHDVQYRRGWDFSNSETGDMAIRIKELLVRAGGTASQSDVGRIVHVGTGVDQIDKLFEKFKQTADVRFSAVMLPRLRQLQSESLGIGGAPEAHERRARALNSWLVRKVNSTSAKMVVERTIVHGGHNSTRLSLDAENPFPMTERLCNLVLGRSYYDLYGALTYCAAKMSPVEQARVETVAHRVLSGTLRLGDQA